jgi:ATP-dependent RNA helicase RhlE
VGLTQAVYPVPRELKSALLMALLRRGDIQEVLAFTRTKHRADRLAKQLLQHGVKAERIHGNRSQAQRTAALAGFKNGHYRVLVATDIAARGIDVEALGHVVNFDVPTTPMTTSTAWEERRGPSSPARRSPSWRPRKREICIGSSAR